jgi:hypothetical protein
VDSRFRDLLISAVLGGNAEIVRVVARERKGNVNGDHMTKKSPLRVACESGAAGVVRVLLDLGEDLVHLYACVEAPALPAVLVSH